jgi:diguanylate cyclase (GGDEF)-like protein/PAS domain S-box-containing protein
MESEENANEQLLNELVTVRHRIVALETSDRERKKVQEALHTEQARFLSLIEQAPFGVFIIGQDGHYQYTNAKFTEIFGYTLQDIPTGREWFLKAYPEEEYRRHVISTWLNDIQQKERKSDIRAKAFTVRCKNGSEKTVYFRSVTMASGEHLVACEASTNNAPQEEDSKKYKERLEELVQRRTAELMQANKELQEEITERRRAEETLRSFQSDLQAQKDSLKVLYAIADKVYSTLDLQKVAEQAVASMMNYSQTPFVHIFALNNATQRLESLYSIGFSEKKHQSAPNVPLAGSLSGIAVAQKDIVTSETIASDDRIELRLKKDLLKQGFQGIISVPLLFQDQALGVIDLFFKERLHSMAGLERKTLLNIGKIIGLAIAHAKYVAQIENEIQERKKTEELLQREREIFYSTLQEAPYGVALMDKDGQYLYINSEFTRITGYTLEDVPMGKDWFRKAFPNKQYRRTSIELWRKDFLRKTFGRSFSVVCKDGAVKEIEFKGTVLEDGRTILMLSDITDRVRTEDELRESEMRYRTLFDSAADAIFVHDLRGRFLDVNAVACNRYGYSKEEFMQMNPQDIMTTKQVKHLVQRVDEIRKQGYFLYETTHQRRDGTSIPTEVSSQIVEYRGRPVVLSLARNITERKQAEKALRASENRLRKFFEAIPEGVIVHDEGGNILYANDVAAKRFEWPVEELIGKNLREIIKSENAAALTEHVGMARTNGSCTFETTYISRTGRQIVAEVNERPIELEGKSAILSVARDITERKRTEKQLAHIATHDALTGLPNRILFNDRLSLALAQAERHRQKLAVLLFDLDRFKDINDTLGHNVGDQLLRVISKRLKGHLRKSDTLARMGGDEFLLLVPNITGLDNTTEVAQKILESFQAPFLLEEYELHITVSIGFTMFPEDGVDAETLLKNADIAMYHAKQKGRNNTQRYTTTMKTKPIE